MSRERFDEIKKIVDEARKDKLQVKLLENKIISMTKIKNLLDRVNDLDPTKEKNDKKICSMYQEIVKDSINLINTINSTGTTETRERLE